MAAASLLVALVVGFYWWRSYHHEDHYVVRQNGNQKEEIQSLKGKLIYITTTDIGGMVSSRYQPMPYPRAIGWCLIIPGFWLALTIRRLLPHPRRGFPLEDRAKMKPS